MKCIFQLGCKMAQKHPKSNRVRCIPKQFDLHLHPNVCPWRQSENFNYFPQLNHISFSQSYSGGNLRWILKKTWRLTITHSSVKNDKILKRCKRTYNFGQLKLANQTIGSNFFLVQPVFWLFSGNILRWNRLDGDFFRPIFADRFRH